LPAVISVRTPRGETVTSAGAGVVYATTVVHRPDEQAYNVCLVDLDEGVRAMGRVEGLAPQDVAIGLRVQARLGDDGVPVYAPE
jgi:uncharacterized OB-fold protein